MCHSHVRHHVTNIPLLQVSGNRSNLLITTGTGQMMVYSHKRLVWAAKGDTCPVAVRVATCAGVQGVFPHMPSSVQAWLAKASRVERHESQQNVHLNRATLLSAAQNKGQLLNTSQN